jgi:hypothetical protein
MSKKTLTQATYDDNTIQSLPDQVKGQASQIKQDFDYAAIQQKSYNNVTLLPELQSETEGDSGANAIGYGLGTVPSVDNVADMLNYLKTRVDATSPTTNIYTSLDNGMVGDGVANDATALNALITTIGSKEATILFTALSTGQATYLLQSNVTFPANISLVFMNGATLKIDNTYSVTGTNTKLEAGFYKIFDLSFGGVVSGGFKFNEAYPQWFGVIGDGSANDTVSIQSAFDSLDDGQVVLFVDGRYKITSPIQINKPIIIKGQGKFTTLIVCDATGGFVIDKVSNVNIRDIELGTVIRHTTTPNTLIGIDIQGDNSNKPFNIYLENVYLDGFETAIQTDYMWSSKFDNVESNFGIKGLKINGQSVNNVITNCSFSGDRSAGSRGIHFIGDVASEGWMIDNTLVYGFEIGIQIVSNAHIYINNCILDFNEVYGVLIQGGVSFGGNVNVDNCYIAMSGSAGSAAISLGNTVSSTFNKGNKISNNTMLVYAGASCQFGIQTNGPEEKYNIYKGNSLKDFGVYDIYNLTGEDIIVSNNQCLSSLGINIFNGDYIHGNVGVVRYQRSTTKFNLGKMTMTYDEAIPTTGTWKWGDIVWKVNPVAGGKVGWVCTVAGTPGTWKAFGSIDV